IGKASRRERAEDLGVALSLKKKLQKKLTLRKLMIAVRDYSKGLVSAESLRGGLEVDPKTGMISGFFFKAEDGIRDWSVTGVQTCALPISSAGDTSTILPRYMTAMRSDTCRTTPR